MRGEAGIVTPLAAGGALTALLVFVGGYGVYDYVQHDPEFCTSCHIMDDAHSRWEDSVHSGISCHACHAPDLAANLHQLWVYWTDPPDKPTHRPEVENSVCYSCHRIDAEPGVPAESWQHVIHEAGHIEHVLEQKIQCVRCHSTSLHQFQPPGDICISCHKHQSLNGSAMQQHCTVCHQYTDAGRDSLLPMRDDCLICHEALQVGTEVFPAPADGQADPAAMHWECGECHKPHERDGVPVSECRGCHEDQIADSDLHQVDFHDDCLDCHVPHLWEAPVSAACLECHDDDHSEGTECTTCH